MMTNPLQRLEYEHEELDILMDAVETALNAPVSCLRQDVLRAAVTRLLQVLPKHIAFEEEMFYIPMHASGQARDPLVPALLREHVDMLATIEHLRRCRCPDGAGACANCQAYLTHLLDVYREHEPREHRKLFPLLEQPVHGTIDASLTVNALLRRHPELAHTLRRFGVEARWHGEDSLEAAAWGCGVPLTELTSALTATIHGNEPTRHHSPQAASLT